MADNHVQSMTGYADASCELPVGTVYCELRSLNHRYFKCDLQLPGRLATLETELYTRLQQLLQRGHINCTLLIQSDKQDSQLNLSAIRALVAKLDTLSAHFNLAPVEPLTLLNYPQLWDNTSLTRQYATQITELVENTARLLITKRLEEGAKLAAALLTINQETQQLLEQLKACNHSTVDQYGKRLKQKIIDADLSINDQRWEQELFFYAQKTDINEELTRLQAHLTAMRQLLTQELVVGKQLDFLMQELNREANTIAAKSQILQQTQLAIKIKTLVEQMREQVQNLL